jgi:alpha-glucuronidase
MRRSAQKFADHERRPPRAQYLRRHRDGAKLAVASAIGHGGHLMQPVYLYEDIAKP